MSFFTLESSFCWNVVIALAHSIWIGCAIGAFTWIVNHLLKSQSPNARYWLNFAALLTFAVLLPVAFCFQAGSSPASAVQVQSDLHIDSAESALQIDVGSEVSTAAVPTQSTRTGVAETAVSADIAASNSWFVLPTWLIRTIAAAYLFGVCFMCFRLSVAILNSQRVLSTTDAISDSALLEKFDSVLDSFSLHFKPAIAKSANIAVPMVAGFLRPVVLLPTSFVTGLTPAEIESVLRHELAHLHRYDHILIVLQRLIESILFFHPVTWYLSRRIHEEREHCCDELAVATGVSRIEYASALLKVAEFSLASRGGESAKSVAMAADGHRPSKLRSRITRLLVPDRAKPATGHRVLLFLTAMLMLSAAWAAGQVLAQDDDKPESAVDDDSAIVTELTETLEQGRRTVDAVESAHIQFKFLRKGGLSVKKNPAQCDAIVEKLRPIDSLAKMKTLIEALTEISANKKTALLNAELHFDQNRTRESIDWRGDTDLHITDQDLSLFWNAANYQMNILPIKESNRHQFTKGDFLKSLLPDDKSPFIAAVKAELNGSEITRCDEGFLVQNKADEEKPIVRDELKISESTGLPFYQRKGSPHGPKVQYWLDWKSYGNGVSFPGALVELNFTKDNTLGYLSVQLVESAKFNIKLPDHLFIMSAPAGANIIRGRKHLGIMQEDVFDVTSEFELKAASKRQPRRELTPEEKRGALVAKKLYSLKDGEVLKRIGPPFPLAHKYVPQMLGQRPDLRPREISRILQFDGDNKLSYRSSINGGVFSARGLALQIFQVHPSAIEGDNELLEKRIPGDFVIRAGAKRKDLEAAFKQILESEYQKDLEVQTTTVDRPLYVASGTLELNPVNGQREVDVNAGPKSEAYPKLIQKGNAQDFLRSLSKYINCDVKIEDVDNGDDEFWWSERFYNLNARPPKDRYDFRIENVLKIVSSQTGLKFEKQSSSKSVLTIRKATD